MNLRQRAACIICAVFLGLFVLLHALSRGIIQANINLLERQDMTDNLDRVQKALAHDVQTLAATAADWAFWDDTYDFLHGKNTAFISSNLTAQSIDALHLNLFVLYDQKGRLVLAKTYDAAAGRMTDAGQAVTAPLASLPDLVQDRPGDAGRSGILLVNGSPCLVAARAVLTSAQQGPRAGTLVLGQFLDATKIKAVSDLTLLPLKLLPLSPSAVPRPVLRRVADDPGEDFQDVIATGEDTVAGYAPLRDLGGQVVALISVVMPRPIHRQGLVMERANVLVLTVVGLIFGLAMLYFVGKYIVSRVARLNADMQALGRDGRTRVTELPGRDEIAGLSRAVNAMLDALDGARARYALAADAANVGVWEMRADDGSLTVDPVIARMLGFPAEEMRLALLEWLARVHPDDRERVRREALAPWGARDVLRESELRVGPIGGECRWLLARGRTIEKTPGQGSVMGTVVDITALREATDNIRALTGQLIAAQESERARIARDLHDNVAQDLSTLKISFETLLDTAPGLAPALKDRLDALSRLLGRSIGSVRDLALALRPPDLEYLGLVRSLRRLCEDFMAVSGLRTSFAAVGLEGVQPGYDAAINLYRIAQEALSNARRHSGGDTVTVRLVESHPMLILRVGDNGHGFDPGLVPTDETGRRGMGLVNMRERAVLLGGTLRVVTAPDQGTTIVAAIPYVEEGEQADAPTADR